MNWDEYFMRHVYLAASKSKDASTHIGAVLVRENRVIGEGFNGICRGVIDAFPHRDERPEKYFWYEHGERNSIYNCAYHGIATKDSVMYTNDVPCADCARAAIQAGIVEIVLHRQWHELGMGEKWKENARRSLEMFEEAGIKIRYFNGELGLESLLNGEVIKI